MHESRPGLSPASLWRSRKIRYATGVSPTNPCTVAQMQQMTTEELLGAEIRSYLMRLKDIQFLTEDQIRILANDREKIINFALSQSRTDLELPQVYPDVKP